MHTINCLWQGLATGFVLSMMLGTVFFALIRNSISFGYKTGIWIAAGVILCDIMFITLALLSQPFAEFLTKYKSEISISGGIVLIVMGILMILKSAPQLQEGKIFNQGSNWYYLGSGFLLNVVNPVNFFSWLGISSFLTIKYQYTIDDKLIFFTASLVSIFLAEVGIAFFASKLRRWISPASLKRINQISGLVFLGVGIKLAFGF
jgi:threonine/homoserine/homoserine lactone efflux protein